MAALHGPAAAQEDVSLSDILLNAVALEFVVHSALQSLPKIQLKDRGFCLPRFLPSLFLPPCSYLNVITRSGIRQRPLDHLVDVGRELLGANAL